MDTITVIVDGLALAVRYLALFFIPGFVISLVLFPRFTDMGLIKRLTSSLVLGIGSVIAFTLCLDVLLGVDATYENISLGLGVFSVLLLVVWFCEVLLMSGSVPPELHQRFSEDYRAFQHHTSRIINPLRDAFGDATISVVIRHESEASGSNHIDHSYLIDVGEEIDIHQVDESRWNAPDRALLPPPHPGTRYFELVIREYKEDGLSLIDDLQVCPVNIKRKPDITFMGLCIAHGNLQSGERLCKKTATADIQWIYHHDFHLFAILYSEDNLGQMVNRVLTKLDQIVTSIKRGSRVSSHVEEVELLKADPDVVWEKPRIHTVSAAVTSKHPEVQVAVALTENDRKKLQSEIVRNLNIHHVTPGTFRITDRMVTGIIIPQEADIDKLKASIKEIQDDDWLFE